MEPLLFLNVGWMDCYQGLRNDDITGGGEFVRTKGYGHEIFNFKPFRGWVYGFGRAPHDSILLENLGAASDDQSINGITVVWVARSLIVGWYTNATVFRKPQRPARNSRRNYRGVAIKYNVKAASQTCTLVEAETRCFRIPRATEVRGGMGRYLWYANGDRWIDFLKRVRRYIRSDGRLTFT